MLHNQHIIFIMLLPQYRLLNLPARYDSRQVDDWLVGLVQGQDKLPHLPFTHPVNDENKKEPFTESVHVSTNDSNASFVKWDDLPHHRTSRILIETSARYLSARLTNACQSKQLRGKSQVDRNVKQLVPYSTVYGSVCTMSVCGWWCVLKKKGTVLFSTSAQPSYVILKNSGLLGGVGIRGALTIFNPDLDEDS